jgi:hypothetical protein
MKRTLLATTLAALGVLAIGTAEARETELIIYKAPNFHGPSDTIKGEVNNLENGFGREVSSMVVRGGAWQVCTGDHFGGRCRVVNEGEYPTLGWLNDKIVSVKFLGDNPDRARYDNWDKRQAQNDRRDNRDRDNRDRPSYQGNQYGNQYGDKDYRNDRPNDRSNDRREDDRYWGSLPR